ncbi:DDB1- and CUL4-associated factor 10 homolog isoform X2 [Arctopsyche grandis]|uniref:DDB1- and CUL4-associated factor 10 homolog isoform X2 n=1 Tax=Arctopsyche grandis TaxID=121162 RepID=UPI00406D8874
MRLLAKDYGAYNALWAYQRELGFAPPIGAGDTFAKSLYSSMSLCAQWDALKDSDGLMHGGVFNLEFSPDGSLLVAACEKNSILTIDPLTYKKVYYVNNAHSDCVNYVKFLDTRTFATCSDDTTVALWDARNLQGPIRTLQGHSNWVKNIEYSVKDKLLVTSGLDGSIYTWDINSYTEWGFVYQRVFHAPGLMRCRISPDASQLVMCTTGGLIIIIHKLNLSTMAQDLHGFKPNMYRLMQMTKQHLPIAAMYDHLFDSNRKRNRVEFISDFPKNNDAQVVSSLQIHPQGWCALSRNISQGDKSEWTCIHDIQEGDNSDNESEEVVVRTSSRITRRTTRAAARGRAAAQNTSGQTNTRQLPARPIRPRRNVNTRNSPSSNTSRRASSVVSQNDVWEALLSVRQQRVRLDLSFRGETNRGFNMQHITGISSGISIPLDNDSLSNVPPFLSNRDRVAQPSRSSSSSSNSSNDNSLVVEYDGIPSENNQVKTRRNVLQNKKRLLYYIQEPNVGKGFIKELCFSADGRLVCSPYGYGVRLLSFTDNCSELPTCVPKTNNPVALTELWKSIYHDDYVVTAKFSPRHFMLATGCLSGRIIWYQPRA